MNSTGKILAAFAIGAVAGVVAGILLAPAKGAETRKNIKNEGKKVADAIKNKFNDVKSKFECAKDKVEEVVEEYA